MSFSFGVSAGVLPNSIGFSGTLDASRNALGYAQAVGDRDGNGYGDFYVHRVDFDNQTVDIAMLYTPVGGNVSPIDADMLFSGQHLHAFHDEQGRVIRGVSDVGDVNGDGLIDYVVEHYVDRSFSVRLTDYTLVFGSNSTVQTSVDLLTPDVSQGVVLQGPLSGLGDINGDGVSDFAMATSSTTGRVIFGNNSSLFTGVLDGNNGFDVNMDGLFRPSALSFDPAGDVNGDGIDDLVVSTDAGYIVGSEKSYLGVATVIYGSNTGSPAQFNLSDIDGTNGFSFGGYGGEINTPRAIGDFNGDGFDDFVVTMDVNVRYGELRDMRTFVVFGDGATARSDFKITDLNGSDGFLLQGPTVQGSSFSYFGSDQRLESAGAGDINGDGYDDLVLSIGSNVQNPSEAFSKSAGMRTYVVFGTAAGFNSTMTLDDLVLSGGAFFLDHTDGNRGIAKDVAFAPDVNGDGIDDLVVRHYEPSGGSGFRVIYGQDTSINNTPTDISIETSQITTRLSAGSEISQINVTDADVLEGHLLTIVSDRSGLFEIRNGSLAFKTGETYSADAPASFDLVVSASDRDSTMLQEVTVNFDLPAITIAGGIGAQVLTGNLEDNMIQSGAGNDTVDGASGDDTFINASGDDLFFGGEGNDFAIAFNGDNDFDGGDGRDTLLGGIGNDSLQGAGGDDYLLGDTATTFYFGDDTLNGGSGNDKLTGSGGADIFEFGTADGSDVIAEFAHFGFVEIGVDFEIGTDKIKLIGFGYLDTSEVLSDLSDGGGGATLKHASFDTTITIYGLNSSDFSASDFLI